MMAAGQETLPFTAALPRVDFRSFSPTSLGVEAATISMLGLQMKSLSRSTAAFFAISFSILCLSGVSHGQFTVGSGNAPQIPSIADDGSGPLNPAPPTGSTPEEIIQKFTRKEAEFKQARDRYTWTQDIKVQDLDGDTVVGEFREVSDIVYDDHGRRLEQVTFAPQPSLQRFGMTKEDIDDLRHRVAFSLLPDEVAKYHVLYVGQQKVDELDTYIFDVAPKTIEKGQRYFQGRIWVDKQDMQIVKTYGKSVPDIGVDPTKKKKHPENENLFPKFVTYREQIDGQYWFPTYTKADEVLHFTGNDVRVREVVKYTNYKRFGSDVKILYGNTDITNNKAPQDQKPATGSSPPKQ